MKKKIMKITALVAAVAAAVALGCIGLTGCGYCAHQLETIEKTESTCIVHGRDYSYRCKKCGKLFAYSAEKGLYEVGEAEELPFAAHTVKGDFGAAPSGGKTMAASLFDYDVTSKCAVCGERFAVPHESLVPIVPPTRTLNDTSGERRTYKGERKFDEAAGRWYTTIQFYKTTRPDDVTMLDPWNDKGWSGHYGAYQRLPLFIPFDTDVPRYAVFIVHNTSDSKAIKIDWSIDGKTYAGVTVGAGEYAPLVVSGTREVTNVDGQYVRVGDPAGGETLGANVVVEMTGFFYTAGTVANLTIDSPPVKTEYKAGESFDPAGLEIYATYTDYCLGKALIAGEYTYNTAGRVLTAEDDRVVFSYGGMSVSVPITVT